MSFGGSDFTMLHTYSKRGGITCKKQNWHILFASIISEPEKSVKILESIFLRGGGGRRDYS